MTRCLALALLLFPGCWHDMPPAQKPVVRERIVKVYVHDDPRVCPGIPEFPPIELINDNAAYMSQLGMWIVYAGSCLSKRTYEIRDLLKPVDWAYRPAYLYNTVVP